MPFVLARNRDAWATIRGFVYQVDLSMQRWLDLGADDALILEHGEDIDVVAGLLADADNATACLLEQVKVRATPLTLGSAAVRASVANFFAHRSANPLLRLTFRFTTTAAVGREQAARFPGGLRGLDAWELLRRDQLAPDQTREVAGVLRTTLRDGSRPEDVPQDAWAAYHAWLESATAADFLAFVRTVEWVTHTPEPSLMRRQLQDRLVALGFAGTSAEAEAQYEQLFAALFQRLSVPGLKQFTRADLNAAMFRPTAIERALVARLRTLHEQLEGRVSTLEHRLDRVEGLIADGAQIEALARAADVVATLAPTQSAPPTLDEPLPPMHGSARAESIGRLLDSHARPLLIAVVGAQFSGKTELARRVAHALGTRHAWVRLGGTSPAAAAEHLVRSLSVLRACHDTTPWPSDWRAASAAAVASLDVLVIDDVPRFREGDSLGQRLLPLLQVCQASGRSAIVTSVWPLPLLDRLGAGGPVVNTVVPSFAPSEVREVLASHGAPAAVLAPELIGLIAGLTSGHPVLLQALAQYLEAQGWALTERVVEDLFRARFAEPVNRDTAQALLEAVADPATRDLLYRLTTAEPPFTASELETLATVPPPVDRRQERFATLVGPWIQEEERGRYTLSPLVRTLGSGDLADETRRGCHRALAQLLLASQHLDATQIWQTVAHFLQAEEPDRAGLVLLQALHTLHSRPDLATMPTNAPEVARILSLWRDTPLPAGMSAHIQLQIRAYHAALAHRAGVSPAAYLAEAEALLTGTPLAPQSVLPASALIAMTFALDDVRTAVRFMVRALTAWSTPEGLALMDRRMEPTGAVRDRALSTLHLTDLALLCSGGVQTEADLEAWLTAVEGLSEGVRRVIFARDESRELLARLATRVVMWAYDTPDDRHAWTHAVASLERLAARADSMGAPALARAALATRLECRLMAGEAPAAVAAAGDALYTAYAQGAGDVDAAFLVARHLGLGLLDVGATADALGWLEGADATPGSGFASDRVHVKMRLARQLVGRDPARAVRVAEEAVQLAITPRRGWLAGADAPEDSSPRSPADEAADTEPGEAPSGTRDLLPLQALGERALVYWAVGERHSAARAMVAALERLFRARDDADEVWRWAAVIMGHATGYVASVLTTGAPPDASTVASPTRPVAEPYVEPRPGVFAALNLAAGSLYRPEATPLLATHVALLADAVEDDCTATRWAVLAVEQAKQMGLWKAAIVPLQLLTTLALLRDDVADALGHATDAASAYWVLRQAGPAAVQGDILAPSVGPSGLARREDHEAGAAEAWRNVDALVLAEAVLPGFFRVAEAWLAESPNWAERLAALRMVCAEQAERAPDAPAWHAALEVCDAWQALLAAQATEASLRELHERLSTDDDLRPLAVGALLGASLGTRVLPVQALYWHLNLGTYVSARYTESTSLYGRVIAPVFEAYWSSTLARARFRFTAPDLVDARLAGLAAQPPALRLQRLLVYVAAGLDVPIPARARAWVQGASG